MINGLLVSLSEDKALALLCLDEQDRFDSLGPPTIKGQVRRQQWPMVQEMYLQRVLMRLSINMEIVKSNILIADIDIL